MNDADFDHLEAEIKKDDNSLERIAKALEELVHIVKTERERHYTQPEPKSNRSRI